MVKRWILIAVGIIVIGGIVLYLLLFREEAPPAPGVIEQILPADTSFYLTVRDLSSFRQGWGEELEILKSDIEKALNLVDKVIREEIKKLGYL